MSRLDLDFYCVTWRIPGFAGCVVPARHMVDDLDHSTCSGCLPAIAHPGSKLCLPCLTRLEQVVASWDTWATALGDEVRALTPEQSGHARPGPRLPLSRMQVEVSVVRGLYTRGEKTLLVWSSTEAGATDAVRFTRAAASTMRSHPVNEQARKLPRTRCPKCKTASMIYQPPAVVGSDAMVKCVLCGYTIDGEHYEKLAAIETQCCRRCRSDDGCVDGSCRCHSSAAVPAWMQSSSPEEVIALDPLNPAHRSLHQALAEQERARSR